jgi:hypothetical protein
MKGLYKKRTKDVRKLTENFTLGTVKKKDFYYTVIISVIIILVCIGISKIVENLLF